MVAGPLREAIGRWIEIISPELHERYMLSERNTRSWAPWRGATCVKLRWACRNHEAVLPPLNQTSADPPPYLPSLTSSVLIILLKKKKNLCFTVCILPQTPTRNETDNTLTHLTDLGMSQVTTQGIHLRIPLCPDTDVTINLTLYSVRRTQWNDTVLHDPWLIWGQVRGNVKWG
jgi:hypothetical protein